MELMFQPLRKYADFTGRARRKEYWLFMLAFSIAELVLMGLTGGFKEEPSTLSGVALVLFCLAVGIPSVAVGVRRLHDTNRSGWWTLLIFLPFIGAITLFVFYVLDGTPGPNRFGPDPKGADDPTPAATLVS